MKKKILYLFSDTGGGHRSAVRALMKAIEELKRDAYTQEMVDVFAECSGFLNIFAKLYAPVIKYSPKLWGRLFYFFDDMRKLEHLEKIASPFFRKELAKLLKDEKPDIIVSVHPMINHITVATMKDIHRRIPMITIVMDPVSVHRAWVCEEVDSLVVATPEAKDTCIKHGITPEKIKILGIPVDPKFLLKPKNKENLKEKMGLDPKLPTVLLMGGGEGAGKMYDFVEALNKSGLAIQLIVICGRNRGLELKLKKLIHRFKIPLSLYGFTDKVPELMDASDLIITKAGPGAVAESLAKNLPMIITSWLPGQEEGNVEYVIREGVGEVTRDPKKVVEIVKRFLDPQELKKIRKNIEKVRKPHAVYDIAKLILSYL